MTIVPPEGASPFDALRGPDGRWSARKLQDLMGYSRWENLLPALKRAMASARNEGLDVEDVFLRSQENPSELGGRPREDFRMTRHAAYLLAMNGDPNKQEVADAQTYFARKTREAEMRASAPALPQDYEEALVHLLDKVRVTKRLESRVKELEPAARSWTVLAAAEGDYSVADAAKFLCRDGDIATGRNRLFNSLLEMRWTYRQQADGRPRAMQYAVDRGWLSEIPQSHVDKETGESKVDAPQIRVTLKGLRELHKRLGGEGRLELSA
ncbi:phage antirepressor KilAC domain-containing protein [Streptomyces sp. NPDC101175]|uniref:phage antirepressor KilAC domain-containing protein n=1 Tax=Streptomyces sp. NPDC101175 TaxID=3366123 RepID=UPI0038372B7F